MMAVALLMMSVAAIAQVTTSSLSGKVTIDDANGEEVIGATIQAVHEPSGTRYAAVTNVTGRFAIQGMRTGGPLYHSGYAYGRSILRHRFLHWLPAQDD